MLLHYFDSKEALISEVMQQIQEELQRVFQNLAAAPPGRNDPHDFLPRFWKVLSAPPNRALLRLLFEVQMLALQNPKRYHRFLTNSGSSWQHLIAQQLPTRRNKAEAATLNNAVIDGLLLDLLSTGDLRRTSKAVDLFNRLCCQSQKPMAGNRRRKPQR